jgi:hypothetical protein
MPQATPSELQQEAAVAAAAEVERLRLALEASEGPCVALKDEVRALQEAAEAKAFFGVEETEEEEGHDWQREAEALKAQGSAWGP